MVSFSRGQADELTLPAHRFNVIISWWEFFKCVYSKLLSPQLSFISIIQWGFSENTFEIARGSVNICSVNLAGDQLICPLGYLHILFTHFITIYMSKS